MSWGRPPDPDEAAADGKVRLTGRGLTGRKAVKLFEPLAQVIDSAIQKIDVTARGIVKDHVPVLQEIVENTTERVERSAKKIVDESLDRPTAIPTAHWLASRNGFAGW